MTLARDTELADEDRGVDSDDGHLVDLLDVVLDLDLVHIEWDAENDVIRRHGLAWSDHGEYCIGEHNTLLQALSVELALGSDVLVGFRHGLFQHGTDALAVLGQCGRHSLLYQGVRCGYLRVTLSGLVRTQTPIKCLALWGSGVFPRVRASAVEDLI